MFYSPFSHIKDIFDISKLQYSDLSVLTSQDECYRVEYKRQYDKECKEHKLPKSVCAFANRNGGWLFIGVNNDGSIADIDLTNITSEGLSSAIASRVQPSPYVTIQILENPQHTGFGVIALYVNEGKYTPYIANGIVYVRNGKISEPAERSTLDLLIKKGYDYSDITLQCLNANRNEFVFSDRTYGENYPNYKTKVAFDKCVYGCNRLALYLQNTGRHFDENIELTIKMPRTRYCDLLSCLNKNPNPAYEKLFYEFTCLPAISEIVEYMSPQVIKPYRPEPQQGTFANTPDYCMKYMKHLFEKAYDDFIIVQDESNVYIKITFKEINPQQKMFLPAMIPCYSSLDCIDYSITSKYSMTLVAGKLIKTT